MPIARMFTSSLKDYPIDGFFTAKTYAIVGASNKKGTLGNIIAENFVQKYKGDVVFVNPKGIAAVWVDSRCRRRAVWKEHLQVREGHQPQGGGSCRRGGCQVCCKFGERAHGEWGEMDHDHHRRFQGVEDP